MLICTKDIQRRCPYSVMCEEACKVAEDSDCADFIRQLFADALMEPPDAIDALEAEYLRQERQAIQEEVSQCP